MPICITRAAREELIWPKDPLPKTATGDDEIGVVDGVQRFAAELQRGALTDTEVAQDRKIHVDDSRGAHTVASDVAESVEGRLPNAVVSNQRLTERLSAGKNGGAQDVRALAAAGGEGVRCVGVGGDCKRRAALRGSNSAECPASCDGTCDASREPPLARPEREFIDGTESEAVADIVLGRPPIGAAIVVVQIGQSIAIGANRIPPLNVLSRNVARV